MSDILPPVTPVKKRAQVKNACVNCQRACKKCDSNRPCQRCIKYSLQETCKDSMRKPRAKGIKRGPYKKRKRPEDMHPPEKGGRASASASIARKTKYLDQPSDDDNDDDDDDDEFTTCSPPAPSGSATWESTGLVTPRSTRRTKHFETQVELSENSGQGIHRSKDLGRGPLLGTFDDTTPATPVVSRLLMPKLSVSPLNLLSDVALLSSSNNSSSHSTNPPSSPLLPSIRKHIPPLSASRFDFTYHRVPPPPPLPSTGDFSRPATATNSPLVTGNSKRQKDVEFAEMQSSCSPTVECQGDRRDSRAVRRLSQLLSRARIDDGDRDNGAGTSSIAGTTPSSANTPFF
ncbi:hypothetical protein LPJ64_002035 [Coemansia asiatica]|uniref:Zn(2)-C6 fungal-type domain-containing protein n=1 Tax=Coemansia asiatica TaxID=1052880 RepID=A0A9W7XNS0_9FUNG|nr:hypothetical protein LPJ64_002035 [Coemansia asiatica]